MTARLPPEEVVAIFTKRVAALENKNITSGRWRAVGNHAQALDSAIADLNAVEREIRRSKT